MPVSDRKTASPAEMAAVLAEYDPLYFERRGRRSSTVVAHLRGAPHGYPFCECGGEKCPNKGWSDDVA
ncbi:hypothetical protein C7C46_18375 [Streptomyces tateyamensis]|uniref:Uncharacterized protein n=1 Tax=Streptomyces tateyamensis TaxID=565073 RepID=A0A2V4NEJ8_9ACTN|nr:hypothetical protein [Streptomyces tateyamensis]PYC77600.1 hypothetical protein C7C46_18375 [Streptomyces tateyamensis]